MGLKILDKRRSEQLRTAKTFRLKTINNASNVYISESDNRIVVEKHIGGRILKRNGRDYQERKTILIKRYPATKKNLQKLSKANNARNIKYRPV